MFNITKQHLLNKLNKLFFIKTDFLYEIRNKKANKIGESYLGIEGDLEYLYKDIKENGMLEPFVVCIGRDLSIRLETGNHRIQIFNKKNIKYVPCVFVFNETSIINSGNGEHFYFLKDILNENFFNNLEFNNNLLFLEPKDIFKQDFIENNIKYAT